MSVPRNAQSFLVEEMTYPGKAGAIRMVKKHDKDLIAGFEHACPCGCGKWSFIRLNPEGWAPGTVPMWKRVSGDDLHMTLTPSIGVLPRDPKTGAYHWHGFLENGIFVER